MTITQSGPICDVCGKYIFFDKSINPFNIKGIKNTLICHDACKEKVLFAMKSNWTALPVGPLRTAFETEEMRRKDSVTME